MTFIQETAPTYRITCDWCMVSSHTGTASKPEGWTTIPAENLGGQPGWHWHWCSECTQKILALRRPVP